MLKHCREGMGTTKIFNKLLLIAYPVLLLADDSCLAEEEKEIDGCGFIAIFRVTTSTLVSITVPFLYYYLLLQRGLNTSPLQPAEFLSSIPLYNIEEYFIWQPFYIVVMDLNRLWYVEVMFFRCIVHNKITH